MTDGMTDTCHIVAMAWRVESRGLSVACSPSELLKDCCRSILFLYVFCRALFQRGRSRCHERRVPCRHAATMVSHTSDLAKQAYAVPAPKKGVIARPAVPPRNR